MKLSIFVTQAQYSHKLTTKEAGGEAAASRNLSSIATNKGFGTLGDVDRG
ncbi:MAG TPA: hypothetical protein VGM18_08445 [Candidatus Sulfotelmatobacter sp.]|jgi:hypothetical protein